MVKTLFYLILFVSVFSWPVFADSAGEYMVSGDKYYNEYDNLAALAEYQKAYAIDPESFEILKRLTLTSNDCGEDLRDTVMDAAQQ